MQLESPSKYRQDVQGPVGHLRWPALDGIRAISIVLVLLVHALVPEAQGGIVGVDVFFVLSGFLITSLLINEWDRRSRIFVRGFYVRRALRLFPALAAAILLALALGHLPLASLPFVVFYVGDIARTLHVNGLGSLSPTWSLSVEEQFYLLWPLILIAVLRRGLQRERVAALLAVLGLADMVYRAALLSTGAGYIPRVTTGPDTRVDGLLIGCALAFWIASRAGRPLERRENWALDGLVIVGLVATWVVVNRGSGANYATLEVGIPIAVFTAAAIIVAVVYGCARALLWALELPALRWLGRRSYGIYLYHYPIFLATQADSSDRSRQLLGIALAVGSAEVSYWLLERPTLRLKSRLAVGDLPAWTGRAPPARGASAALAD